MQARHSRLPAHCLLFAVIFVGAVLVGNPRALGAQGPSPKASEPPTAWNMERVGGYPNPTRDVDIVVDSGRLYASVRDDEYVHSFNIVDISDLANPVLLGSCYVGEEDFNGLAVAGGVACVADSELHFYDVSNPAAATLLGSYTPTADVWLFNPEIEGDLALATMHNGSGGQNGVIILDISEPSSPQLTATIVLAKDYDRRLCIEGDRLYVISGNMLGVDIYDISVPASPSYLGCFFSEDARDAVVSNNILYLADSVRGLLTVDVTDPMAPVLLAHNASLIVEEAGPWTIDLAGDLLSVGWGGYWTDLRYDTGVNLSEAPKMSKLPGPRSMPLGSAI